LRAVYRPVLAWALSHRAIVVTIGVGFLAGAGVLIPRLGGEFLPTLEEGNLWIRATMPPTISLEAGMPVVDRIRQILRSRPEVITVVSQHGRPDDGSDAAGFNNAEFFAPLKPMEQWTPGMTKEWLIAELQKLFSGEFTGVTFNFSQYIQDNIEEGLSGVKGANSVKIIGRVAPEYRNSLERVRHVKVGIPNSGGANAYIPLSDLATITLDTGASYIFHERNQRYIPIKFSVRGRDLGGTVAAAQEQIAR